VAAIHRAKLVLLHYPRTPQVKGALKIMKDSYGKLGLSKLEQSSAKMISYNFPTKHV
jgi:outer membrane protein assembly factor BamD (BamD/ComL family)